MPVLEGRFAWVNQYAPDPRIDRAKAAGLRGAIIKYGLRDVEQAYEGAGLKWAIERYVLPVQPEAEGTMLADAVSAGACAAVINAEVEWQGVSAEPMIRLIDTIRARHPTVELYASVDTRGNRLWLPYQQVLRQHIAGWLPMYYPLAYRPHRPEGFVAAGARDCLDDRDFGGIPVLPTIQTYGGIGGQAVTEQIHECKRRGLTGYQAYTIAHATDEEWAAIVADKPQEEEMPTLEERIAALEQKIAAADAANVLQTQLIQAWVAYNFAPLSHVGDKGPHIDSARLRQLDELYEKYGVK